MLRLLVCIPLLAVLAARPRSRTVPRLVTIREASVMLGVTHWTIYRLAKAGELRLIDISPTDSNRRSWRVDINDINDLITRRTAS